MAVDSSPPADRATPAADGDASAFAVEVSLADQLRRGPIVVAVTGQPDSYAAVRAARGLEQRYGGRVSAVQVIDISHAPLPAPLPSAFTLARDLIGDAPYAADARARRQQFTDLLGEPNEWPVHIALGTPAHEILRYAEQQGAALIAMGLRRHGVVDRILHDETTLTVARRAHATVLGVVPGLHHLPGTAVVGVDFGPASIRAARAALDVLARPAGGSSAALRLVYVDRSRSEAAREETAGERLIRQLGVTAAFEGLVRELAAPPAVSVETTVLFGDPARELLAYAADRSADLIAVGSLRHERVERWILGSVTTEVIRDGRCSMLVIPPR